MAANSRRGARRRAPVLGRGEDRLRSVGRAGLGEKVRQCSPVKIKIAWIGKTKEPAIASLTEEYLKRISRYVSTEGLTLRDEAALLEMCGRLGKSESKSTLVLMDSRGKEFSSEQFAKFLGNYQDRNPLPLTLAVGGADGFSDAT